MAFQPIPELITPATAHNNDELFNYTAATLRGAWKGMAGLAHMVAHPLDTVVYPLSSLAFDATVISSQHYTQMDRLVGSINPDDRAMLAIGMMVQGNPAVYNDAKDRMEARIAAAKAAGIHYANAPAAEQVEIMSQHITSFLVPGAIIRGVKMIGNAQEFGMLRTPPKFHNLAVEDLANPIPKPKMFSVDELRQVQGYKSFTYVFTEDRELLIALTNLPYKVRRQVNGVAYETTKLFHPELAQLKPVYAAGELLVKDGQIAKINKFSGHYKPHGQHLDGLLEKAFTAKGFKEVKPATILADELAGASAIVTQERLRAGIVPGLVVDGLLAANDDRVAKSKVTNIRDSPNGIPVVDLDVGDNIIPPRLSANDNPAPNGDEPVYEIIPCAGEFYLDEAEQSEFVQCAEAATSAQCELVKLVSTNTPLAITPAMSKKLMSIAEPMFEFGMLGANISQLALMTGGHKRTWNGINAACQSTLSLASGLASIAAAKTMMSLGAVTGMVGVAIGAIGLVMSIFGDSDGETGDGTGAILEAIAQSHRAIMEALQQLHRAMIEGFQRMEELLVGCILGRLNQLGAKLDRLERITTYSFKELHSKELIDIVDVIGKEIRGEHKLQSAEKRDYLRRLSTWIDCHSKSQLQTSLVRHGGSVDGVVKLLSSPDFDMLSMFPLFLTTLVSVVPVLGNYIGDVTMIPNLEIFAVACEMYILACGRTDYSEGFDSSAILTRAKKSFNAVTEIIDKIRCYNLVPYASDGRQSYSGESTIGLLLRQYQHYRLHAGLCICKCRDTGGLTDSPLGQQLKPGANTENLMAQLGEMELRRILLIKLYELWDQDDLQKYNLRDIKLLESMESILNRKGNDYKQPAEWVGYAKNGDLLAFKRALEMGANPNATDYWGNIAHYITKYGSGDQASHTNFAQKNQQNLLLYLLLKTPDVQLGARTTADLGDTWGCGGLPILHAMNSGRFAMGILMTAYGFDIWNNDGRGVPYGFAHFNASHMGNAHNWAENNSVPSVLNIRFVNSMKNPESDINKSALRKAFQYYKAVESGQIIAGDDVSQHCVLLLTCIIGDLLPLQNLPKLTIDLNVHIYEVGITYLMLASYNNHLHVCKYLITLGASRTILAQTDGLPSGSYTLVLKSGNHCAELACYNSAWITAKHFSDACALTNKLIIDKQLRLTRPAAPLTNDQIQLIVGGYREIDQVSATSIYELAMIAKPHVFVDTASMSAVKTLKSVGRLRARAGVADKVPEHKENVNRFVIDHLARIDQFLLTPKPVVSAAIASVQIIIPAQLLTTCKTFAMLLQNPIDQCGADHDGVVKPAANQLSISVKKLTTSSSKDELLLIVSNFNIMDAILRTVNPRYALGDNIATLKADLMRLIN